MKTIINLTLILSICFIGLGSHLSAQCPPEFSYCYNDNETNNVAFEVCDASAIVDIYIYQGSFEMGFDDLTIYEGASASGTTGTVVLGPMEGDLKGTTASTTTAGNCLIFVTNSDGSFSCASNSQDELIVFQAPSNPFHVTSTSDTGPGSLREAVDCAPSGAPITFDPGIDMSAITLASQIIIDKDLTILGNGMANTIIDGAGYTDGRLFDILAGYTVHIEKLTLQNGGGGSYSGLGAAIFSQGNTSILSCNFSNNNTNGGSIIYQTDGSLDVVNSEFVENGLSATGPGETIIWIENNSDAAIHQCLFTSNDTDSRLIFAGLGTDLDFLHNTVSNNATGIAGLNLQGAGTFNVANNILNDTGDLLALSSSASATTSHNLLEHADPELLAADGNIVGNPAFVGAGDFSLTAASDAISAGDASVIASDILDVDEDGDTSEILPIDLKGDSRISDCFPLDIGAYEYLDPSLQNITVTNTNDSGAGSLREVLACAPDGATIIFDPSTNGNSIVLLSGDLAPANTNITIKGNGIGQTIIDGNDQNIDLFELSGQALTVEDLTVQKFKSDKGSLVFMDNSSFFRFYNCALNGCGTGLFSIIECRSSTIELENSTFSNVEGSAPYVFDISSTSLVKQCLFYDHTISSFEMFGNKSNSDVSYIQNTFTNINLTITFNPIIKIQGDANVNIYNNIIFGNTATADVKNFGTGALLASGNISQFPGDLPAGSYITEDPLLNSNYKLTACSPAISAADPIHAPAMDTEGDARPLTAALPNNFGVDIGWDEYTGSACPEGTCAQPIPVSCSGVPYNGNTTDGGNVISAYTCIGWNEGGPEKVHVISTQEAGDITASLSNLNSDLDVFLVSTCGDGMTCLAYGNFSFTYSNAPAGTYYIIVDGYVNGDFYHYGDYTLTVNATCNPSPCTENTLVHTAADYPTGVYEINQTITSSAKVQLDATYQAGSSIDLLSGFEVLPGSVFEAVIESPCTP